MTLGTCYNTVHSKHVLKTVRGNKKWWINCHIEELFFFFLQQKQLRCRARWDKKQTKVAEQTGGLMWFRSGSSVSMQETKRKNPGTRRGCFIHLWRIKCSLVMKAKCRPQDHLQASTNGIISSGISENKCLSFAPAVEQTQLQQNSLRWPWSSYMSCFDAHETCREQSSYDWT